MLLLRGKSTYPGCSDFWNHLYLQLTRVLRNTRDPQEEALATLAEALNLIENGQQESVEDRQ